MIPQISEWLMCWLSCSIKGRRAWEGIPPTCSPQSFFFFFFFFFFFLIFALSDMHFAPSMPPSKKKKKKKKKSGAATVCCIISAGINFQGQRLNTAWSPKLVDDVLYHFCWNKFPGGQRLAEHPFRKDLNRLLSLLQTMEMKRNILQHP